MGDEFHSNGGEQNIAQGQNAIGKQENNHGSVISTTGNQAPAVNAQGDVTITYGVPFEKYEQVRDECERLKLEYGIKDVAFASFFRILNQENIPCAEWGAKLSEIAFRYKELLLRFEAVTSDDPQVQSLKEQAKQAIEDGDYDRAEKLLNQAKERDRAAVATLKASLAEQQAALEKRQLSEAQSCVSQAVLQRLQYRYEKSAQYWQEAAYALSEGRKLERAEYLGAAGNDLYCIARYAVALSLYEQSLFISGEIGDRKGEGVMLNNISGIYQMQGDYEKALEYLEQSLLVCREFGDKEVESATLNNISQIYHAKGACSKALSYLEQSLLIQRELRSKEGESAILSNIGSIHDMQGDYAAAIECYEQALTISRKIDDKRMESVCLNNISSLCYIQGKYKAALECFEQSLVITKHIGDRQGEGTTLNNIGMVYNSRGDSVAALKHYKQSLAIRQEIGDKDGEAVTSANIGMIYAMQDKLPKAEQYISRAVELGTQLDRPDLEDWQKGLKIVRAKLRGR